MSDTAASVLRAAAVAEGQGRREEALALYRDTAVTGLELANAVRPMALLQEELGGHEQAKQLWLEARRLYEAAGIQQGTEECERHLGRLRAWECGSAERADEPDERHPGRRSSPAKHR